MSPSRKAPPSAVVGLDIGTDSIKVAEAKYGKDGVTITAVGVARTPPGVIENEVIVDPKALGSAVKALLAESGIKTKQVVSSVAGQSRVVVRVIEVPKMSRDELAETMKWEVERHVPFSPTEVVMDFQPLDRPTGDPDAQSMEVLLAVAQQELIDSHVQTLLAAGLKPMAIDIEPLACGRSLLETSGNGARDQIVAIVNIGANNTDLGIFEQGVLAFPSPPLSIAGMSFTREVSETLAQTLDEAETTKKEYASVKLDAFAAAPPIVDDDAAAQAAPAAEPTQFDTAFTPGAGAASAFDLGGGPAAQTPGAEPAPSAGFQNTVDGPVFDTPDSIGVPAFDVGEPAAPAAPAFDLGGDDEPAQAAQPEQPAAPAFDLGGAEPAFDLGGAEPAFELGGAEPAKLDDTGPVFDLDDVPSVPAQDEPASPSFDLSDTDEHADPGEQAQPEPVHAPAIPTGEMADMVFEAISGVLVDLANELRRSLEYYNTRYSRMPERVFLCGGTAKMPHLAEFLSEQLGIPVEVGDPVKNLNSKVTGMSDRYLHEVAPMFSVSIGLAIRDMIG